MEAGDPTGRLLITLLEGRVSDIDWLPIATIPDSQKDGRLVLLWTDAPKLGLFRAGALSSEHWVDELGYPIRKAEFWAAIQPPR